MTINIKNVFNKLTEIFIFLFLSLSLTISFALGEDNNYGAYVLLFFLVGIFIFQILANGGKIRLKITKFHVWLIAFIFVGIISMINARSVTVAFERVIDIIEIFVMVSIFFFYFDKNDSVDRMLKLAMIVGYFVSFYTVAYYGIDYFIAVLASHLRIDNEALNANTVGLCAAYSILINLYFMLYKRKSIFDIAIIPALIILASSGSRKALIALVLGGLFLYCIKNIDNRKIINTIFRISIILVVVSIIGFFILQLPIFEETLKRLEELVNGLMLGTQLDSSSEKRFDLVELGWDLFFTSPLTGVGLNNPQLYTYFTYQIEGYYLHNNYIELLAGTGIAGVLTYYLFYIYIGLSLWRYRDWQNGEFNIVLILFLLRLILDYGMVSYEMKLTYYYLLVFYFEVRALKKKKKKNLFMNL